MECPNQIRCERFHSDEFQLADCWAISRGISFAYGNAGSWLGSVAFVATSKTQSVKCQRHLLIDGALSSNQVQFRFPRDFVPEFIQSETEANRDNCIHPKDATVWNFFFSLSL